MRASRSGFQRSQAALLPVHAAPSQIGDLNAQIQAAEATVHAAELDVGYCRVTAPFDAYITNLDIAVGEYAREGGAYPSRRAMVIS